jgi:hypothetical protein
MAATKLNPDAQPFPCPYAVHHHPGTPFLQYHSDAACPPGLGGAVCFYAHFPFPSPDHHPFVQFPVLHPSQVIRKAGGVHPARKAARAFRNRASPQKALCPTSRRRPLPWTRWTPSRKFTTPRRLPLPHKPPAFLGSCSTVMFRNIPNRLK